MLRACRRVLHPSGRIAFYTIFIPAGLTEEARKRAALAAPRFIASQPHMQQELLQRAGFTDVVELDVTPEFLRVTRGWFDVRKQRARELRKAEGKASFAQRQAENQATAAAIEAGLLRRSLFVARRP